MAAAKRLERGIAIDGQYGASPRAKLEQRHLMAVGLGNRTLLGFGQLAKPTVS
jgi:hypothetical protein